MATINATVLSGSPSVRVNVDDIPVGYRVTVYRLYGSVESVVRDADYRFASGGFSVVDYEAPGGVPVNYRAELFDEAGLSEGFTGTATVSLAWDPSMVWFSDPLDPGNALLVEARAEFAPRMTRKRSTQEYQVGSRVVSLLGVLGKLNGLSLNVQTQTLEDADAFERVLEATNVLVRTMPPARLPRALYVSLPEPEQVPQNVQWGGEWVQWDLTGNEISSPDLGVVIPIVTWQTYIDAFATWGDFNAAYLTWNDAIRNPPEV